MKRTLRTEFGCPVLAAGFFFCGCSHLGKTTNVEIWVFPTLDDPTAGLLK